ncbi:MAG: hypothetical protein ACK4ME_01300 [Fimbriimonadales bacterium]
MRRWMGLLEVSIVLGACRPAPMEGEPHEWVPELRVAARDKEYDTRGIVCLLCPTDFREQRQLLIHYGRPECWDARDPLLHVRAVQRLSYSFRRARMC